MISELCPFCKMPKRIDRTIVENKFMVFYECGTTEIHTQEQSQFSGWSHTRQINKQSSPCLEICRLRNTIETMMNE